MDDATFFREATLGICSHLDMARSMQACLEVIAAYIPAERLLCHLFDHGTGAMRTIAMATRDEAMTTDLLTVIPARSRTLEVVMGLEPVRISNRPLEEPINREMVRFFGLEESSLLLMFLETEDHPRLGHLTLVARGNDRYDEEHQRRFGLLKEPFTIALANALEVRRVKELQAALEDDKQYLTRALRGEDGGKVIGEDGGLQETMALVDAVAATASPVLLLGETGVGKDVVATAIHERSPRQDGPFIKVNCGAIPEGLADSELFGHEKGAFTGAVAKSRGRFERAQGGTIFLDEVGELPPSVQVRLLRVLQHKELERVGGARTIPLDVRVIAATNQPLVELVASGRFRKDLYYRLDVVSISIPRLAERPGDLPALVAHLVAKKARELRLPVVPDIHHGSFLALADYDWPGNVRELENLVERALILHRGGLLELTPVPRRTPDRPLEPPPPVSAPSPEPARRLDDVIRAHIEATLQATGGKVHGPGGAAALLDINPGTLRHRMRKLGISFGRGSR